MDLIDVLFDSSATSEAINTQGKDIVGIFCDTPVGTKVVVHTSLDGGVTYVEAQKDGAANELGLVDGILNLCEASQFSGISPMIKLVSDDTEDQTMLLATRDFK